MAEPQKPICILLLFYFTSLCVPRLGIFLGYCPPCFLKHLSLNLELDWMVLSQLPPHLPVLGFSVLASASSFSPGCWDPRSGSYISGEVTFPTELSPRLHLMLFKKPASLFAYAHVFGLQICTCAVCVWCPWRSEKGIPLLESEGL